MSYTHFTLNERKYLQELFLENKSIREIASILGRSPSSVSREIRRNGSKPKKSDSRPYRYHPWRAECLAIQRRRSNTRRALQKDTPEWDYIVSKLKESWSPETICGRWHKDFPDRKPLHFSTIYRYITNKEFPSITPKTHLRRRGKRLFPRKSNYNSVQPDRIIPEWPEEIRNRLRIGDWEGDTVYGGIGKGLLVTLVDRKSRYTRIGLLMKRAADATRDVVEKLLAGLPVNSISFDNGSEFSEFRQLEEHLHTLVYFAEPHKPWQRGTNENTNDMIRFFYPKGFDFRTVTESDIASVEALLNNRPRKCLDWKTPFEVFWEKSVALD